MRTRQTIALLLAAVYLLMTVGAPVATLSCECLSSHDHAELFCPCHAGEASGVGRVPGRALLPGSPLYGDRTLSLLIESIGKYLRCAVTDLPPALAADRTLSAPLSEGDASPRRTMRRACSRSRFACSGIPGASVRGVITWSASRYCVIRPARAEKAIRAGSPFLILSAGRAVETADLPFRKIRRQSRMAGSERGKYALQPGCNAFPLPLPRKKASFMKQTVLSLLFLLFSSASVSTLRAQDLRGVVRDADNQPLVGASVYWAGTTVGASTDAQGSLPAAPREGLRPSGRLLPGLCERYAAYRRRGFACGVHAPCRRR